ncbi:MAG: RNA 2',3'-cyclic phosphodiesterase [Eubacteriales bacterium]
MRVFYAVTFQEKTKEKLKEVKNIIERNAEKGRFTDYKNYHITLEFIGEVDCDELVKLKDIIKELKTFPEVLNFDKIGNFDRRGGDIVWIGIEDNPILNKLNEELKSLLESKGFETDKRKFTPHLTIGRKVEMKTSYESIHIHAISGKVESIALMESNRIKGNITYEPLFEIQV